MILAYQFLARDRAGLTLSGVSEDGELEWVGSAAEWRQVERLEAEILSCV